MNIDFLNLSWWQEFQIMLLVIMIVYLIREIVSWLLGTNRIYDELKEIKKILKEINKK